MSSIASVRSRPRPAPASLHRFVAHPAYDTTVLRTDLARFQFLLGGDETPLFGLSDT